MIHSLWINGVYQGTAGASTYTWHTRVTGGSSHVGLYSPYRDGINAVLVSRLIEVFILFGEYLDPGVDGSCERIEAEQWS